MSQFYEIYKVCVYSESELFLSAAFQVIIQLSDCWRFIFLISVFSSTWLSVPWGKNKLFVS